MSRTELTALFIISA